MTEVIPKYPTDGMWSPPLPSAFDIDMWPFVLLDILWRTWEARNG
jgi:hypothetical protein